MDASKGLRPTTDGDLFDGPGRPFVAPGADRLVELHVLAEHGDHDAAARAAEWLAADAVAYRTWHEVEQTCQEIRQGS